MTQEQSADSSSTNQENSTALFAQLVLQQTNMALMLLGKVAHPESGQTYKDVEAARMFIDQLEMLETKTKGNLSREESALLKQSLMNLRLAFVDAVESDQGQSTAAAARPDAPSQGSPGTPAAETSAASSSVEEEHRKKFSKKY